MWHSISLAPRPPDMTSHLQAIEPPGEGESSPEVNLGARSFEWDPVEVADAMTHVPPEELKFITRMAGWTGSLTRCRRELGRLKMSTGRGSARR